MTSSPVRKPAKRTRERADITRSKLLDTAVTLFANHGYDGVTLRDIEKSADVHRGLASYHFEDKPSLWKAAADACLRRMRVEADHRTSILKELSTEERLAFIVRFYVRFGAKHPEVAALVSQEARKNTWRTQYLIDEHIRPACDAMEALVGESLGLDRQEFIHWYYILISASSTIFYFAPECEMLFGVDSRSEAMVERHAELLVEMLVRNQPSFAATP